MAQFRRGDLVEVVEFKRGGNRQAKYEIKRLGKVLATYRRFAVVEFIRGYRECVWTDQDESNNPVMRRVTS